MLQLTWMSEIDGENSDYCFLRAWFFDQLWGLEKDWWRNGEGKKNGVSWCKWRERSLELNLISPRCSSIADFFFQESDKCHSNMRMGGKLSRSNTRAKLVRQICTTRDINLSSYRVLEILELINLSLNNYHIIMLINL